ncbi:MAG TPA: hypothetical protein VJS12_12080 [Steroidobacteraceae bacterium]|nr:hypothetical protein [Steroidobacteraceae bacterium]
MRRFSSPSAAKMWSSAELKQLRNLTDAGIGVEIIAARLKRTVSAVRNKACMHGFSLSAASRQEQTRSYE